MVRGLLLTLMFIAAPSWGVDALDKKALETLQSFAYSAPNLGTAGRLQAGDIDVIAKAGVRHVIDLTVDSETPDFDEAAAVRSAGMKYHNLPIRDADDLTPDNVAKLDQLIAEIGDVPILVHCGSGDRAGAMTTLRAVWFQGQSAETALAEGRRRGLKKLEPAVRDRLGIPEDSDLDK